MECLLHLAYRLDFKRWRASSVVDKARVEARKTLTQEKFLTQLGLKFDFPRQGSGNSNDGNTARRFLQTMK